MSSVGSNSSSSSNSDAIAQQIIEQQQLQDTINQQQQKLNSLEQGDTDQNAVQDNTVYGSNPPPSLEPPVK